MLESFFNKVTGPQAFPVNITKILISTTTFLRKTLPAFLGLKVSLGKLVKIRFSYLLSAFLYFLNEMPKISLLLDLLLCFLVKHSKYVQVEFNLT